MLPLITLEWFNTPYYYALYSNRNDEEAARFIRNLFSCGIIHPGDKVLDLACGMGRHARVMNECGADVLGVDYAEDVIEQARKDEEDGLRFEVHDMLDPIPWPGEDVVTNLFTSFGYFSHDQNRQVLRNVAECLRPGGRFVLDYLSARWVIDHLVPTNAKTVGDYHFEMNRFVEDRVIYKQIEVFDKEMPVGTFVEGVQAYTMTDLTAMLAEAGLEVEMHFGTYDLNSPHIEGESPRLILVARKRVYS